MPGARVGIKSGTKRNVRGPMSHEGAIHMMTHPYISAALGDEHRKTLLEQATAARLAPGFRSSTRTWSTDPAREMRKQH
jgi:hypothetical protein